MGASEGDADLYADVARGLVKECEEHDVRFDRGDLFEFLLQLSPIHEALTVVDLDPIDRVTSLQIKSLFSLWIVVVDDEMDVHGGHSELHASMAWLTGVLTGSGAPQPGRGTKGAVFLLERLSELLLARHGMDARISLDVLQCV